MNSIHGQPRQPLPGSSSFVAKLTTKQDCVIHGHRNFDQDGQVIALMTVEVLDAS